MPASDLGLVVFLALGAAGGDALDERSAPSTRSLVVSVSVALIATWLSLKPASPQMPWERLALGTAV